MSSQYTEKEFYIGSVIRFVWKLKIRNLSILYLHKQLYNLIKVKKMAV